MSVAAVRAFLEMAAPDLVVIETDASSATVAEAAAAHGVAPDQIAKTLSLRVRGRVVLVVAAGEARLDNRKIRAALGGKASFLGADEVEAVTGHPVGGVCPFGLPAPLPVYCDLSLKAWNVVVPAAGSPNSALFIAPDRLAELTRATWVDLCRDRDAGEPAST